MNKRYLTAIILSLFSLDIQAIPSWKTEKIPLDVRAYMSILAKKGNMLTDYEKDYMKSLGHGDVKEDRPISAKTFHEAFFNELESGSQAMTYYQQGQEDLANEKSNK